MKFKSLVERIEAGPKISVWWIGVAFIVSTVLAAIMTVLELWFKR